MRRRFLAATAAVAAAALAAWIVLRPSPPAPIPFPSPGTTVPNDRVVPAGNSPARPETPSDWRRKARTNPADRDRLRDLLGDPARREWAAAVLGTLDDPAAQAALLDALGRATDPAWRRILILALGSAKDAGEDDEVFDLPNSPYVVRLPSGLTLRIQWVLEDPAVRSALETAMTGPPEVREAAILSLQHSLEFPDAREAFRRNLLAEPDPALQGSLGGALAQWVATQRSGSDRGEVLRALWEGAQNPEASALRFRMEDGLRKSRLEEAEVRTVAGFLEAPDFDRKRWAIAVLAAQPDPRGELLSSFARLAASDPHPKVRELAVAAAGRDPDRPEAWAVLQAGLADGAWHVRAAAADAMGRARKVETQALQVLERIAREDPDAAVREAAARSWRRLSSR